MELKRSTIAGRVAVGTEVLANSIPLLKVQEHDGKIYVDVVNLKPGAMHVQHGPFDDQEAAEKYIQHRVDEGSGVLAVDGAEGLTEGEQQEMDRLSGLPIVDTYKGVRIVLDAEADLYHLVGSFADPTGVLGFTTVEEAHQWIDDNEFKHQGERIAGSVGSLAAGDTGTFVEELVEHYNGKNIFKLTNKDLNHVDFTVKNEQGEYLLGEDETEREFPSVEEARAAIDAINAKNQQNAQ